MTSLKRRLQAKREKRSQMGNFGPGGPSSAVSGNTPTVQATTPMTAPTVPPASTTVSKVGHAQVMFAAWADEFEKLAAESAASRSILKDFAAGVDPTGTSTFNYGLADPNVSRGQALSRKAVGVTGGLLGGALTVPAGISGLIGAGQAFSKAPGGIRSRLAAMPGGFAYGAKKPFAQLYHAGRASSVLRKAEREGAKALTELDIDKLKRFGEHMTPAGIGKLRGAERFGKFVGDPENIRSGLSLMKPEELAALRSTVGGEASAAAMGLGTSGLIGGGSAALQYDRGRQVGAQHQRELETLKAARR